MQRIIKYFFLFLPALLNAQVAIDQQEFEMGEISRLNEDVLDLNLSSQLDQKIYLLRIDAPSNMAVKYTSKTFGSYEAQLLRIKLNPKKKGDFKEKIQLYFSPNMEPTTITIKGKVVEVPRNGLQSCPDFGGNKTATSSISGFRRQQKGDIQDFFVRIYDVNQPLEPLLAEVDPEESNELETEMPEEEEVKVEEPVVVEVEEKEEVAEVIEEPIVEEAVEEETAVEDPNLLSAAYKPNNIVFLIDASTSMRHDDKMDLLKQAMIELLEPLRSIDYLSIVTYSGEAQILMPPTAANDKSRIEQKINGIVAEGSTQAVKGIKKAYEVANDRFLLEGNNEILLVTDGAFDIGERNESLRRKIKQNAKRGIKLSVLGIKNEKWTKRSLGEIVDLGDGNLLRLKSEKDIKVLLEEIKSQSAIAER